VVVVRVAGRSVCVGIRNRNRNRNRGREGGRKGGRKGGKKEGREEGREEGRKEGRKEGTFLPPNERTNWPARPELQERERERMGSMWGGGLRKRMMGGREWDGKNCTGS
jgi:hypothetical protein